MYYKLKTSLLEQTLNDVLSEDDEDGFDVSCLQSESASDFNISSQNLSQMMSVDIIDDSCPDGVEKFIRHFEAAEELKINHDAWGEHLNNKRDVVEKQQNISPAKPIPKTTLKPELFGTQKLLTRNPRKSLTKRLSVPAALKSNALVSSSEKLPDLETILAQKSAIVENEKIQPVNATLPSQPPSIRALNEGWLNRCNSMNSLRSGVSTIESTTSLNTSTHRQSYGLSNVSLPSQSFDHGSIASNLGGSSTSFGMSSLNLDSSYLTSGGGGGTSCENIYDKAKNISDDDEIVENSEDESSQNTSLHIRKKRRLSRAISSLTPPTVTVQSVVNVVKAVVQDSDALNKPTASTKKIETVSRPKRRMCYNTSSYKSDDESTQSEDPFAVDGDSDKDPDFKLKSEESSPVKIKGLYNF